MGMSDDGNFGALANDIGGLINYVEVLVSGKGGSTTGGPLGDKFFLKTGGKCTDVASKKLVDRYIYIDNIPDGSIPIVSSGMGIKFNEFRGLINTDPNDQFIHIWREYNDNKQPKSWRVWPHSTSKGWLERIEQNIKYE